MLVQADYPDNRLTFHCETLAYPGMVSVSFPGKLRSFSVCLKFSEVPASCALRAARLQ